MLRKVMILALAAALSAGTASVATARGGGGGGGHGGGGGFGGGHAMGGFSGGGGWGWAPVSGPARAVSDTATLQAGFSASVGHYGDPLPSAEFSHNSGFGHNFHRGERHFQGYTGGYLGYCNYNPYGYLYDDCLNSP